MMSLFYSGCKVFPFSSTAVHYIVNSYSGRVDNSNFKKLSEKEIKVLNSVKIATFSCHTAGNSREFNIR